MAWLIENTFFQPKSIKNQSNIVLEASQKFCQVDCTVTLTDNNPMDGDDHQCFFRPDSDVSMTGGTENQAGFYTSVGIFNTRGKQIESLKVGGVSGTVNGGSSVYFDATFTFTSDAQVTYKFHGDSTEYSTNFADCQDPKGTHIWS